MKEEFHVYTTPTPKPTSSPPWDDPQQQIESLTATVAALQRQIETLTIRHNSHLPPTTPPLSPFNHRDPRIPDVSPFSGDPREAADFFWNLSVYFEGQPNSFATPRAKIFYTISRLTGMAASWARNYAALHPGYEEDWGAFYEALEGTFQDRHRASTARQALLDNVQKQRPFQQYQQDFWTHAMDSQHNDTTLKDLFLRGLNLQIRMALVAVPHLHQLSLQDTIRAAEEASHSLAMIAYDRKAIQEGEQRRWKWDGPKTAPNNPLQNPAAHTSRPVCSFCKIPGHTADMCRKKIRAEAEMSKRKVEIRATTEGEATEKHTDTEHFP